ncbi:MAG: M1 family aminopeptidase [Acidimicrobiia bacterium]
MPPLRRRSPAVLAAVLALAAAACRSGDERSSADVSDRSPSTAAPGRAGTTVAPLLTVPPAATSPTCPATPRRAEPDPNRPRYRLTVDVRLAENTVVGTTEVRFTPDLETDRLVFRLWANGPRPTQAGGSMEAGEVTVDGRAAAVEASADATILDVRPGRTLARGRAIEARVPWTLHLPASSNDRIARTGDAVRLGSFFPILGWEPGVGWRTEPPTGAFAEASTAPVADFDMTVTVPDGLTVLASGTSDRPGHWTAHAMRDVALSVGRFTTASATAMAPGPVEVTVGVHHGIAEPPQRYLDRVVAVLEDFAGRFGPYPWPSYTLAITPGLGGGIEYPSHVMQGPGTIGRTTSHEVAHMWFYGLVGNNQGRDPWLDEGLASWGEARFEDALAEFRAFRQPAAARGRMGEPMTYWANAASAYYSGVYVQGVQALADLGPPDLVDCALRTYVAVYAHRIARPADLVAALRASFPDAAEVLARYGVST